MGNFDRKYSDEQRDAMGHAYEDRRIRPARLVVELAARGALEWKGVALDPFQTNENTVRDCAKDLRKKRSGQRTSQLSTLEPRDAIEALRLRLVNAADALLKDWEKEIAKPGKNADPERGRQIARLVREVASMPGPKDPKPRKPGSNEGGQRTEGTIRAGLAGSILHAARAGTAQDNTHPMQVQGHSSTHEPERSGAAAHAQPAAQDAHSAAQPGSQPSDHGTAFSMA